MDLLEQELAHIDDDDMVVKYEIENQDLMARIANNMALMLLYNSITPAQGKNAPDIRAVPDQKREKRACPCEN